MMGGGVAGMIKLINPATFNRRFVFWVRLTLTDTQWDASRYTRSARLPYAGTNDVGGAKLLPVMTFCWRRCLLCAVRCATWQLWVGPSSMWGAVQGVQLGFRKSISE